MKNSPNKFYKMDFEKFIERYDNPQKKGFHYNDILSDLKLIEDFDSNQNAKYEYLIHSLQPYEESCQWGTYLGPFIVGRSHNGSPIEYPEESSITAGLLKYAEQRMRITQNPRMKMQYAAICWDFLKKKNILVPSDLFLIYVKSLTDTINGDYENHHVITVTDIVRLFSLKRDKNSKNALRGFVIRNGRDDNAVRIWGTELNLIIKYKNDFTEDEKNIVIKEHEDRLQRIQTSLDSIFVLKDQVCILADCYRQRSQTKDILRVLNVYETCLNKECNSKGFLWQEDTLSDLSSLYNNYNLQTEGKRIDKKVADVGVNVPSELKTKSFEYTLTPEDKAKIDSYVKEMTEGDDNDLLHKFISHNIIKKEDTNLLVKNYAAKAPLWAMTPTQMYDEKGRPMSILGSVEDDLEGHLVYTAANQVKFSAQLLHLIIKKLINNEGCLCQKKISVIIKQSVIIEKKRIEFIERALQFYYDSDYVVFCHLIVSQIEEVIRNIVEKSGNTVIKRQKIMGYQLKTLDELVRDSSIQSVFTEDGAFYLRMLLTDQKGLNIRNILCHGISSPQCFQEMVADRLFHALLMLSTAQYVFSS